jgi:C4-dicarboxylate-specific signal transduction histidine kinase
LLASSSDGSGVIAMLLDVDSRKRADIQSHEQEISAIHANRIFNIGMLVSGVAHELNNPLSALRLGNEQLQLQAAAQTIDGDRIARIARAQADAVTRMDRIISSLLRFARKDEDTNLKMVHVGTLVQDTVQLTRAMANENNVDVTWDAVPDQLTLLGHPVELAQALVNLVSNGIQHVASLPRPRWVHLRVEVKNGDYLFQVSDSGLSSAIEHPERLFTPFYTTKGVGHGTGLGLTLSQGIAEAHAGSLTLDGNSQNTCFVMKIPSRPIEQN